MIASLDSTHSMDAVTLYYVISIEFITFLYKWTYVALAGNE